MKITCLIIFQLLIYTSLFSQQKTKATGDLFQKLDRAEKEMAETAKYDYYRVRYDENMKPYLEVSYRNDSQKTLTTFSAYYDYLLNEKEFRSKQLIQQKIKPHQLKKFKVEISDELLKYYHKPTDFLMKQFVFNNLRYSDGSLKDVYIILAHNHK